MGRIIVITSGKGGVGKTTVTANLGAALARMGKRTLLIDTDTGLRNLDIAMGMEDAVLYDVIDVSEGDKTFEDAAHPYGQYPNLYILSTSQTKSKEDLDKEKFASFCRKLRARFDYILIDCPAGIEYGFSCALSPADEAVIVTIPDRAAIRDADRVAGIIEQDFPNIEKTWLCVNRLIPELAETGRTADAAQALFTVAVKLIGIIPEDPRVMVNAYKGELSVMDRRSQAGIAVTKIARRLNGETVPLTDFGKKRLFRRKYR